METLIGLFFFLLIVLFSLDCFISVRSHFAMLKEAEISNTSVYAGLDRMRRDLFEAGSGLIEPLEMGILEAISDESAALRIMSRGPLLSLVEALAAGQLEIFTPDTASVKKGQLVVIFDQRRGEVHSVITVDPNSVVIDSPLQSDYRQEDAKMIVMRRVSLFLDEPDGIIRRKVNTSPAQPLLEGVASFEFEYIEENNLAKLGIRLRSDEEKKYETLVFPKNTAISSDSIEK